MLVDEFVNIHKASSNTHYDHVVFDLDKSSFHSITVYALVLTLQSHNLKTYSHRCRVDILPKLSVDWVVFDRMIYHFVAHLNHFLESLYLRL
jgi:hypothetical protein